LNKQQEEVAITPSENSRLTEFSPGAGCGCKISPRDLSAILGSQIEKFTDPRLLVGNASRDDAAVFDLGDGNALVSTTDFFTPIVDDPFTFGQIAAVNAISDVYAMGARPLVAIAILGWPLSKLPADVAGRVIDGGRSACARAGIALGGGHSIDISDPIFGLAVTGMVPTAGILRNDTAVAGCELFLTKPLGMGVITTAEKRKLVEQNHLRAAVELMATLNDIGLELAANAHVRAVTDVTGFGLLGHLLEMCQGSGLSAEIHASATPRLPGVEDYISRGCFPGGTKRNWNSYGDKVEFADMSAEQTEAARQILCDPQTSGGLLVAVEPAGSDAFLATAAKRGLDLRSLGTLVNDPAGRIRVLP